MEVAGGPLPQASLEKREMRMAHAPGFVLGRSKDVDVRSRLWVSHNRNRVRTLLKILCVPAKKGGCLWRIVCRFS